MFPGIAKLNENGNLFKKRMFAITLELVAGSIQSSLRTLSSHPRIYYGDIFF